MEMNNCIQGEATRTEGSGYPCRWEPLAALCCWAACCDGLLLLPPNIHPTQPVLPLPLGDAPGLDCACAGVVNGCRDAPDGCRFRGVTWECCV